MNENPSGEVGYFALARRDLERGGEQVYIVTALPVARSVLSALSYERDRSELEADRDSPYRWFVVRLDPEQIARLPPGSTEA